MKVINAYRALDAWLAANLLDNVATLAKAAQRDANGRIGRHRARGIRRALFGPYRPTHGYGAVGATSVAYMLWETRRADIIRERATGKLRTLALGALSA